MMREANFAWLLLFFAASFAQAQREPVSTQPEAPQPLSLDEAVRVALKKHPALKQAEAAVAKAEAEVKQARANYFPQLTFSGIGKVGLSGATGALGLPGFPGSPFYRNLAYSANWYQTIFDFGRSRHLVASREALAENARFEKQAERNRVVLAVRRAYFSVLEARRLERLAEEIVKERKLTLARIQAYAEAQMQSKLDVKMAEANLHEAQGGLAQARHARHTALASLRAAMGVEEDTTYDLMEPPLEVQPLTPLGGYFQAALQDRPELRGLEAKLRALSERLGIAHDERLPEIRSFAAGGQGRFNGTPVKENQRHGLGALGVIFPIFTGGRLEAQERYARAELEESQASRLLMRVQVKLEVTQAYETLGAGLERMEAATEQERAAREAFRLAQARFQAQMVSFLELTAAELGLVRAETSNAQSRYDYERAKADLEFALGKPAIR